MDLIKVGKLIAKCRKEKNMTQEELAEKFNITDKSVSKWERGINAPDITILNDLCKELGISVDELLSGEKDLVSKEEKDKITIDAINYYNKISRHKSFIKLAAIILLITFTFLLLFTINNYNKCLVYSITSKDDNIKANGFIIFNQSEKIMILNNIIYNDKYEGTDFQKKVKSIDIKVATDNKVVFILYENNYNEDINLSDVLKTININLIEKNENDQEIINKNDLSNMYLIINYYDSKDKKNELKFELNFDQEFSNNKLFY